MSEGVDARLARWSREIEAVDAVVHDVLQTLVRSRDPAVLRHTIATVTAGEPFRAAVARLDAVLGEAHAARAWEAVRPLFSGRRAAVWAGVWLVDERLSTVLTARDEPALDRALSDLIAFDDALDFRERARLLGEAFRRATAALPDPRAPFVAAAAVAPDIGPHGGESLRAALLSVGRDEDEDVSDLGDPEEP